MIQTDRPKMNPCKLNSEIIGGTLNRINLDDPDLLART